MTRVNNKDIVTKFKIENEDLLSIKDAYPKLLVARTKHEESQYEGIRIIDIARWLFNSQK